MNADQFHDMIHSARCEGFREGHTKGWREATAIHEYDKEDSATKHRAQGFVAGFAICTFLSMFWLLFFGLFTL